LETVLIICSITSETVSVKVGGVHYDTISDSGNDSETAKQDGDEQGVEENEEAVAEGCGQHAAQPAHEITAKKSGIHEKDDRNTDGAASEGEANEAEPDETERVNTRFSCTQKCTLSDIRLLPSSDKTRMEEC
jgi:hypothetical protein